MIAEKKIGMLTYTGFDDVNNGTFVIETKGDWTYVNYQRDEFTQVIVGYVVKQIDGRYKAFQLDDRTIKYFDSLDGGVEYIKSLKE